jgi:molybdopterin molybdotransferase
MVLNFIALSLILSGVIGVTALVVARPFLFDCQGIKHADVVPVRQRALFDMKGSGRQVYHRIRSGVDGAEIFKQQSSGALYSTCWGDGLAVQEIDKDIAKGDLINVVPYVLFN